MTTAASPSVASIAGTVSTVDEAILKFMPFVSILVSAIPGAQVAAPFIPLVGELLTVVDNAAKAVAGGDTNAAIQDVLGEIMSHLTPGKPNSPILSAPAVVTPAVTP